MHARLCAWNSYIQRSTIYGVRSTDQWHKAPKKAGVSTGFHNPVCSAAPVATQRKAVSAGADWNESAYNNTGLQSVAHLANAWSSLSSRLGHAMNVPDDLIITALKLALSFLPPGNVDHIVVAMRADGREPLARAVCLGATLADLSSAGVPLDAEAIAAGIVLEAVDYGLDIESIKLRLGPGVATLVHDVLRIRTAPTRVELYDDVASSAIREWCLAFHDVRANVLEVVCRLDELQNMSGLPLSEQQILALEALQLFAPLGHALSLGVISSRIEDLCFKILFPASYNHTSEWLRDVVDVAEDSLFECQQQLLAALDDHVRFKELAASCVIRARTKSLFSIMKKVLRLEDLSRGGRQKEEIYDVLGMRAIVQPRSDLPPLEAQTRALEACYIVREVAESLWTAMPGRSKDYITQPKQNGYQSIHLSLRLQGQLRHDDQGGSSSGQPSYHRSSGKAAMLPYLELQIRTLLMDELAEAGEASHASYKGGLDSRQARQLRDWTHQLRQQLASQHHGQLMLPAPQGSCCSGGGNNSGKVEAPPSEDAVGQAAKALFSNWDVDGNGVLSVDEVREQLQELGAGEAVAATGAEALMLFLAAEEQRVEGAMGPDASGEVAAAKREITLHEFSRFVRKVSLVGALDRLDKEQVRDMSPQQP